MESFKKLFSSYTTTLVLLAIYASGLALATLVERVFHPLMARLLVYYSPVFIVLQLALVVNLILVVQRRKLFNRRKAGFLLLHGALAVIMAGALTTHLTGREGTIHLREGETTGQMTSHTNRGASIHRLPFEVELVRFTMTYYPGSESPSSYESELRIRTADGHVRAETVAMNRPVDVAGYRLFQASFDDDGNGTTLSVSHDVAGSAITFSGYALLLLGIVGCMIAPDGRLRTLYRQLQRTATIGAGVVALLLAALPYRAAAQSAPDATRIPIPAAHAGRFGRLPVQSTGGRIVPMNTFASEILRKLHRRTTFGTMDANRFLLSLSALPEMWMHIPVVAVPDKGLQAFLQLPDGVCSYNQLFAPDGSYRLQSTIEQAYAKHPEYRTAYEREAIKLDERIHILDRLFRGELLRLYPVGHDATQRWLAPADDLSAFSGTDSVFVATAFGHYLATVRTAMRSGNWASADRELAAIEAFQYRHNTISGVTPAQIGLEVTYNRLDLFNRCRMAYLVSGGLLLLAAFATLFTDNRRIRLLQQALTVVVGIAVIAHVAGMGMRWMIAGYAPWSNSYETMIFAALATVGAGMTFVRRSAVTFALATLFAGVILFVAGLQWMDPQISPLVPVLKSPWLMFHVAVIMIAYGFFGIGFLLGLTNLTLMSFSRSTFSTKSKRAIEELSLINEMSLLIGMLLMTLGTFMGAVWANESWGRYWGWDPKETWALITIVVYALTTHLRLVPRCNNRWLFNVCSTAAFGSVLMTYFGVNYYLSGMHSYGNTEGIDGALIYIGIAVVGIGLLSVSARRGYTHLSKTDKANELSTINE